MGVDESARGRESTSDWREEEVSLLVTDVRESLRLWGDLGASRARRLFLGQEAKLGEVVRREGGRVLKTMGDGLLALFPDPASCVTAAMKCLPEMRIWNESRPREERLRVRLVGHFGRAHVGRGDVLGELPGVADRLLDLTAVEQVVITEALYTRVATDLPYEFRPLGKYLVSGLATPVRIFDVHEKNDMVTVVEPLRLDRSQAPVRLSLLWDGREILHPGPRGRIHLGRDEACDVVVDDKRVSREHCEIVQQAGKFVLRDRSVNGTDVEQEGDVVHIRRGEEVILRLTGRIFLGGRTCPPVGFRVATK